MFRWESYDPFTNQKKCANEKRGSEMKIFLISGAEHTNIVETSLKKVTVINKMSVVLDGALEFFGENTPSFDKVLVTDGGLSADPEDNLRDLEALVNSVESDVVVVTRDFLFEPPTSGIRIIVSQRFRPTDAEIGLALKDATGETEKKDKTKGFFGVFAGDADKKAIRKKFSDKKKKRGYEEEVPTSNISILSQIIVVTGHRGSGVTSTAASVARMACDKGIRTIFVDLDVDYRAANLYFGAFTQQADSDDDICSSLIRMLARPQDYEIQAVDAERNLWVTSLGYGFRDTRLIEQHFTEAKIIGLLTSLKHEFGLVIADLPLDVLTKVPALLNNVDTFALCMENNIYSIVSTMRNIEIGFERRSDISYLASKTKLVVTKYNDESAYDDEIITPDKLGEMIESGDFSDDFTADLPTAGKVAYSHEFDRQIESDISVIYNDEEMKQAYESILLRLLGVER